MGTVSDLILGIIIISGIFAIFLGGGKEYVYVSTYTKTKTMTTYGKGGVLFVENHSVIVGKDVYKKHKIHRDSSGKVYKITVYDGETEKNFIIENSK